MTALYDKAIEALLDMLELMAQQKPATGESVQQALLKVEIAIDRACTDPAAPDNVARLMRLRDQLLTASKYAYHAQPCQY